MSKQNIIICTNDFSGLGWGLLAKNQGDNAVIAYQMKEDEEKKKEFSLVGNGMITKIELDKLIKKSGLVQADFIFDSNHLSEESEYLKKQGKHVFGASAFQYKLENDRAFAANLAKSVGFDIPTTKEFSSIEEGLAFLDENPDKGYVFKPDGAEESHLTYVPCHEIPEEANRELYDYMQYMEDDPGTYILQELVKGVETNCEVWFYQGTPFFAFVGLESKRESNDDEGEMVGCGHDLAFTVPLESGIVKRTVGKYFPYLKTIKYTGFMDANVILKDKKSYFLENCARFGYNSHPNLFHNLCMDTFGNVMHDVITGNVKNFYDRFREGFGATVSLSIRHPRKGLPIDIPKDVADKIYLYDTYVENDTILTAGYDHQVGIAMGYDFTPKDAADDAIDTFRKIKYPNRVGRTDLNKDLTEHFPIRRYEALQEMGLIKQNHG